MYSEKVFLTSNDVDDHYELKISALFRYLQQVSTNHAELIGLGKKDTVDKGMFWVITRMKVVIHKLPKMLETIIVSTHPGKTSIFMFPRFYEVHNEKGELLIQASASWVLLDLITHRVKMKPFADDFEVPYEISENDIALPEKVVHTSLNFLEERKVRYSDIDLNGHLNNTKYIEYIIDVHDKKFYEQYRVKEITINYEKEINDGDIVTLSSDNQIPEIIVGELKETRSFTAKIDYQKR